ncbi:hypothetical protein ACJ41O_010558 [Fusarium nematophilum]
MALDEYTRKIAELESRLARYEEHGSSTSSIANEATSPEPQASAFAPSPRSVEPTLDSPLIDTNVAPLHPTQSQPSTPNSAALPQFSTPRDLQASTQIPHPTPRPTGPYTISTIAAESSLSSSNEFGRKVQEVLAKSRSTRSGESLTTPSPQYSHPSSLTATTTVGTPPQLPTEEEAFRLLEAVSLFIGQTQSHYDSREISDRVGLLYENSNDPVPTHELWYLQVLLIFAVGKVFAAEFDRGQRLPGTGLFEFVHQNFPSLSVLYTAGRMGVEINALMAMYLQMTNRKEEAYLYISSALRLAVLHGYHQENSGQKLLRSERAQINRLWWTIYMQERRLAAATGTPSGINDDAIDLPLPSDASGFPPAAATRTNIKIARVTGQVITILYGTKFKKQEDFVSNAQQIIKSLFDISTEIPSEQSLHPAGGSSSLALRTAASLHLMLYQATLLTIRPLMFHITQLILGGHQPTSAELTCGTLGKLSKTCSEAARRLLKVIIALNKRNLVALFGFFDCDAIFSAAFIMLLTKIFDSACDPDQRIDPVPGLQEAMDMLQYLADRGNAFARQRFQEVQSVWSHLSTILQVPDTLDSGAAQVNPTSTAEPNSQENQHHIPSASPVTGAQGDEEGLAQSEGNLPANGYPWDALMWNNIPDMWVHPMDSTSEGYSMGNLVADLPLEDSFDQYQSLLNDPDWVLTGQDVGDFAELRRHVLRLNP